MLRAMAGDPRYLEGVQWRIEQRCKILGFYAPQRGIVGVITPDDAAPAQLQRPEVVALGHQLLAAISEEG